MEKRRIDSRTKQRKTQEMSTPLQSAFSVFRSQWFPNRERPKRCLHRSRVRSRCPDRSGDLCSLLNKTWQNISNHFWGKSFLCSKQSLPGTFNSCTNFKAKVVWGRQQKGWTQGQVRTGVWQFLYGIWRLPCGSFGKGGPDSKQPRKGERKGRGNTVLGDAFPALWRAWEAGDRCQEEGRQQLSRVISLQGGGKVYTGFMRHLEDLQIHEWKC